MSTVVSAWLWVKLGGVRWAFAKWMKETGSVWILTHPCQISVFLKADLDFLKWSIEMVQMCSKLLCCGFCCCWGTRLWVPKTKNVVTKGHLIPQWGHSEGSKYFSAQFPLLSSYSWLIINGATLLQDNANWQYACTSAHPLRPNFLSIWPYWGFFRSPASKLSMSLSKSFIGPVYMYSAGSPCIYGNFGN